MDDATRTLGGRYEVGDLLGRGGMADVHVARDTRLGRSVAIKLLRSDMARDPVFQARFRREAQSAAGLNHPAIVAVYDSGEEVRSDYGGAPVHLPYIVMEHVVGRTVREVLTSAGGSGVGLERAVAITTGVLAALEYSHRHGVVHRDIKPANAMVTPVGAVKVMDFGIARSVADSSATMTQTSAVIGTAQYLSPEQAQGQVVDARTDLYSTGCLLYELLTGRPPFTGDSAVAVAYQHVREAPLPPSALEPSVSADVDRVVLHALAKDREDRYATAADFAADLQAAAAGRAVAAPAVALATVSGPTRAAGATAATRAVTSGAHAVDATVLSPGAAVGAGARGRGGTGHPPTGELWVDLREEAGGPSVRSGRRADGASPGRRRRGRVAALVLGLVLVLVAAGAGTWYVTSAGRVVVPPLVGRTRTAAVQALGDVDLRAETSTRASDRAEGTVLSQDPSSGTRMAAHGAVAIVVSSGPASVAVPDVHGRSEADALRLLQAAGLTEGATKTQDEPSVAAGRVVTSDPAAGTSVTKGSSVALVLSSGKVTLPDLQGESASSAKRTLASLGLTAFVFSQRSSTYAAGLVSIQSPAPGPVDPGSQVTLVVSTGSGSTTAPTPTPTPTPSASASPTSEPSPSDTPTDDPSPSPSDSASATSEPSGTPTSTPAGAVWTSAPPLPGPSPTS